MKLQFKIFFFIILSFFLKSNAEIASLRGLDGYQESVIDATKNARNHSNFGNLYFKEGNYIAAIKEYELAYALNENSQASAIYLYNISRCLLNLKDYPRAYATVKQAIHRDYLNITFYELEADCILKLNFQDKALDEIFKNEKNPYNKLTAGFIYLKTCQKQRAITLFDDMINDNPDLLISTDLKNLIKRIK